MATLIRGDGRTVNAYQDSIMGDFAFSGKDGIIKNIGQACGLDTGTLNIAKIKSGMVVIQGRQITLDGTDSISLPVATGSTAYWTTLYLELDLSAIADDGKAGKVTLKKLEYTSSYPAVPTSDNLKIQTAGKAYLGLYRFKNTVNGITSSEQLAEVIDSKDILNNIQTVSDKVDTEVQKAIDDLNARLEEMGFKTGSVSGFPVTTTLTKQAKYAIWKIPKWTATSQGYFNATLSFVSAETFSVRIPAERPTGQTAIFNFTKGSKIVEVGAQINSEVYASQIGFVIE